MRGLRKPPIVMKRRDKIRKFRERNATRAKRQKSPAGMAKVASSSARSEVRSAQRQQRQRCLCCDETNRASNNFLESFRSRS